MSTLEAQKVARAMDNEANDVEVKPGPYVRPGNPAIPLNHTTPAAFLLKWRSIEMLVKPWLENEKIRVDDFPMHQEKRRGILRVSVTKLKARICPRARLQLLSQQIEELARHDVVPLPAQDGDDVMILVGEQVVGLQIAVGQNKRASAETGIHPPLNVFSKKMKIV